MTDMTFPVPQPTFQIPLPPPTSAYLLANLNTIVTLSNVPAMGTPSGTLDSGLTTALASILSTAQAAIAAYKPAT